ncbi:CAP domain-containing protein [Solibacillus sp. FSL K6-1523]|uniref:CAP domain-containing protein n=1 Tax=Solibacillus sp. FSL K6-1523 TaxID=2921471 RepID=UPI004046D110
MKKQFMTFCAVILLATQAPIANASEATPKSPELPKRGYNHQLATYNPYEMVKFKYNEMTSLEDSSMIAVSYYGLKLQIPKVNWGQIVKPSQKPNWNLIVKPEWKPSEKPVWKPEWKPSEKPVWKPEWKPSEKPEDKPVDKPSEKPEDKPVDKPIEKPEDKPVDKPIEKPEDKPVDKPSEKPEDKPVDKPIEKPEDKPVDKPIEKPEDKPVDKPIEKPEDKPSEKPEDQPVVKPGEPEGDKQEQGSSTIDAIEAKVVELTNVERAKSGLKPLQIDRPLMASAREKSQDMKINNYFSHTSPTWGSPFDQLKKRGISYSSAGENIAKGQQTAEKVVEGWMNSAGHRANILDGNYTHIGVGYVKDGNIWTQQFIKK